MELSKTQPLPDLSPRSKECLVYIAWYYSKYFRYPTHREVARALGLSKATVTASGYIEPLVRKGILEKSPNNGKRNIRLTELADRLINNDELVSYERKMSEQ